VKVLPATAVVTVGHSVSFTSFIGSAQAREVAWRVLEPGGGSIDGAGAYHASGTPGLFTVEAGFKDLPGRTATARVTVVAQPAGAIEAPSPVMPGTGEQTARIAPVQGSTYVWSVVGGSLTRGTDTPAITFMAGPGPKVVLTCKVTNLAGDSLLFSREIPVARPVKLTIHPASVTITAGRTMKFGFDIDGGLTLGVAWKLGEPGAGSLDDSGNYVAPAVPGAYTVRLASLDDPTQVAIAQVKVVPKPPENLVSPAAFQPGAQGLRAMVPEVAGMKYAWEIEGGTIQSGADSATVVFNAGEATTLTLRCRITNEAGDSFLAVRSLDVS
jgi:hypothetical protein